MSAVVKLTVQSKTVKQCFYIMKWTYTSYSVSDISGTKTDCRISRMKSFSNTTILIIRWMLLVIAHNQTCHLLLIFDIHYIMRNSATNRESIQPPQRNSIMSRAWTKTQLLQFSKTSAHKLISGSSTKRAFTNCQSHFIKIRFIAELKDASKGSGTRQNTSNQNRYLVPQ